CRPRFDQQRLSGLEDERPDDVAGVVVPDRFDLLPDVGQPVADADAEQLEQEPEEGERDEPDGDLSKPLMPGRDYLDQRLGNGTAHATDRLLCRCADEQSGADGTPVLAELCQAHWRVTCGIEDVRTHLGADALRSTPAEASSEAAAQDDAIDVKEVDDGGTRRGDGVVRVVDEFERERVVLLEGAFPDAAREAIPVRLAHEVEQLRSLSAFVERARAGLHCRSARVRLRAATAAAGTDTPTELHHGVSQLAGCPVAFPPPTSGHGRAAEAGSPPDGKKGREVAAGAELELRLRGNCDVVSHPHPGPHAPNKFLGEGVRIGPAARQVRVESHRARGSVDNARRSDSDSCQLIDAHGCRVGGVLNSSSKCSTPRRCAALGRCLPARTAKDLTLPLDYQGIDLRSAKVDPGAHRIRAYSTACDTVRPVNQRLRVAF